MLPQDSNNSPSLSYILDDELRLRELAESLVAFLQQQRWFAAKTEGIQSVKILDSVQIPGQHATFELLLATVVTTGGSSDCYAVPMTERASGDTESTDASIVTLTGDGTSAKPGLALVECSGQPEFWRAITSTLADRTLTTRNGRKLTMPRTANSRLGAGVTFRDSVLTIHGGEQSNSAVAIGDQFFLKLFRRPRVGHNPDAEVGIFLTDRTDFRNSPRVEATIDIIGSDGHRCLALISEQVQGDSDAWTYTLNSLKDYWKRLAELKGRPESPPRPESLDTETILEQCSATESLLSNLMGDFRNSVVQLGRRTAELHSALSSCDTDADFAPEVLTQESLRHLIEGIRAEVESTRVLLEKSELPAGSANSLPQNISERANSLLDGMLTIDAAQANVVSIRCHGDYHLGQVLRTEDDFVILDFEGEPDRPFDERRQKRCAMKDVAGMIRSLHYASCTTSVGMLPAPHPEITNAASWQTWWYESARTGFLIGYEQEATGKKYFPGNRIVFQQLLDLFLIEKVLYELRYEINNRPDWVQIPLVGLNTVLGLKV